MLQHTIDAMPDAVLILNGRRQIVGANRRLLQMLECSFSQVLGRRLGELLGCKNAACGPDACGTSRVCSLCGAVNAVLDCQRLNDQVTRECRISPADPVGTALDLMVSASSVRVEGERFTICVAKDISDQKRLSVLTRLFFHDLMNIAGCIQGYAELLQGRLASLSPEDEELAELAQLSEELVEEIRSQRDLTYAESGELEPEFRPVQTWALLQYLQRICERQPAACNRRIVLDDIWQGQIVTDARLLRRVLGNMIKNALEAVPPGGVVTVRCAAQGDNSVVFSVHNPGSISPEVQGQVFQRSFSTKAESGRGIGTHSMKLFGERYLSGRVSFTSDEANGTTFRIRLAKLPGGVRI